MSEKYQLSQLLPLLSANSQSKLYKQTHAATIGQSCSVLVCFPNDSFCEGKKTFVICYPKEATSQACLYQTFELHG